MTTNTQTSNMRAALDIFAEAQAARAEADALDIVWDGDVPTFPGLSCENPY